MVADKPKSKWGFFSIKMQFCQVNVMALWDIKLPAFQKKAAGFYKSGLHCVTLATFSQLYEEYLLFFRQSWQDAMTRLY